MSVVVRTEKGSEEHADGSAVVGVTDAAAVQDDESGTAAGGAWFEGNRKSAREYDEMMTRRWRLNMCRDYLKSHRNRATPAKIHLSSCPLQGTLTSQTYSSLVEETYTGTVSALAASGYGSLWSFGI